jgi:hypothetical protein
LNPQSGEPSGQRDAVETVPDPGQALAAGTRTFFETRFDHDFSDVRVHADANAAKSAHAMSALAYTVGRDVVFGAAQYAPETETGRRLLAHELAHVVQQRHAGEPAQGAATDVSQPGDAAERRAEQAAEAVLGNRPVGNVGSIPAGTIHRVPVPTNGGEFDTTTYRPVNDAHRADAAGVGKIVGAHIELTFTPNSLVVADHIGLTQTVNTMESSVAGGPVSTPSSVGARNAALSLTAAEGEQGRAVDQGDSGDADTIPNTSPLYNVENTPGSIATTLTDVPANVAPHASRTRTAAGGFNSQTGTLADEPTRPITFAGQQYNQKFEVAALVLDGPMANTYLGTVEWGWNSDAAGTAALDPAAIRMVSAGAPTTAFMDAARKWNAASFTDPTTGSTHATADLPIIADDPASSIDDLHSGSTRAADRGTRNLIAWINMVNFQLTTLGAGVERTNKLFEKQALENALRTRSIGASVEVVETTSGPGADDVYVRITRGGRSVRTPVQKLKDGRTGTFAIPLERLVPLDGPLTVEIFEEDTLSADDLVARMSWPSPYEEPLRNAESYQGANYRVTVGFR